MSICALKLNKELYKRSEDSQSDVFNSKLGYETPSFERKYDQKQAKRFLLEQREEGIMKMEQVVRDFEQNKIKEQKKFFVDHQKQLNHD
jgi:hypothetical protein